MNFCKCMAPMGLKEAIGDIVDEFREFVEEPSMDEFSDIMWGFGRLIAGLFGKVYIRMPFDRMHYKKVVARMEEYDCVRSKRHLINGVCPKEDSK